MDVEVEVEEKIEEKVKKKVEEKVDEKVTEKVEVEEGGGSIHLKVNKTEELTPDCFHASLYCSIA